MFSKQKTIGSFPLFFLFIFFSCQTSLSNGIFRSVGNFWTYLFTIIHSMAIITKEHTCDRGSFFHYIFLKGNFVKILILIYWEDE